MKMKSFNDFIEESHSSKYYTDYPVGNPYKGPGEYVKTKRSKVKGLDTVSIKNAAAVRGGHVKNEEVTIDETSKYDKSEVAKHGEGRKRARRDTTAAMERDGWGYAKVGRQQKERQERHEKDRGVKTKGTKAGHSGSAYPTKSATIDTMYPHKKEARLKRKLASRKATVEEVVIEKVLGKHHHNQSGNRINEFNRPGGDVLPPYPRRRPKPYPLPGPKPSSDKPVPRKPVPPETKGVKPQGLKRIATGIADFATGNKWDLDKRGGLKTGEKPKGLQRVATGVADFATDDKFDFDKRSTPSQVFKKTPPALPSRLPQTPKKPIPPGPSSETPKKPIPPGPSSETPKTPKTSTKPVPDGKKIVKDIKTLGQSELDKIIKSGKKSGNKVLTDLKKSGKIDKTLGELIKKTETKEEYVSELNRYGKETGKATGSLNKRPGTPVKKGGDEPSALRNVRRMIRKETGKPEGQKRRDYDERHKDQDRRESPGTTIAKIRDRKARADAAMRDTRGT